MPTSPSKTAIGFLLLFGAQSAATPFHVAAQENIVHQEVGDVVFRKLSPAPFGLYENVHSAIYKGFLRSYETTSVYEVLDTGFNHDVIEMEGVRSTKFCKTSKIYRCIDTWSGIRPLEFRNFKTTNPPYYGAYFSKNQALNTKQARAMVIETAERLLRRVPRVQYAVITNEPAEQLKQEYFRYEDVPGNSFIDESQITRMRSDAFVEYCYASAGMQILQHNIRTVEGATALMDVPSARIESYLKA